jgi:hypothetical protein
MQMMYPRFTTLRPRAKSTGPKSVAAVKLHRCSLAAHIESPRLDVSRMSQVDGKQARRLGVTPGSILLVMCFTTFWYQETSF